MEAAVPSSPPLPVWHWSVRILFRFFFAYEVIFNLPFPIGRFAGMAGAFQSFMFVYRFDLAYMRQWDKIVAWAGPYFFDVTVDLTNRSFASGDRLYDWVRLYCVVLMAVAVAAAWSLVDWKRRSYPRLLDLLRAYLRLNVGCSMLYYGFDKVFCSQFRILM